MATTTFLQSSHDYQRIEQAIKFLQSNFRQQPSLSEIAKSVHLTEYHFQRLFTRWVGISPKRFMQYLTKEYAKELLERSHNLLDVTYETGLSSPGRLHDLFVTCEAMTPGEFKSEGQGLTIHYGIHPSPFGESLVAVTERGICGLYFVKNGNQKQAIGYLENKWKHAELKHSPRKTQPLIDRIFAFRNGSQQNPLQLHLLGTNFQIKVWEALLKIPPGTIVSYQDLAIHLGMPNASRAVGNAVAKNPIAFIIPCHRVVRKAGETGSYLGGPMRKKAMLAWEAAKFRNGKIS